VSKKDRKKKGRNNTSDRKRDGERLDFHRARARNIALTHARIRERNAHARLLVAAHPVAVLTSSARYSVCAIEISFIPDARKVGARN